MSRFRPESIEVELKKNSYFVFLISVGIISHWRWFIPGFVSQFSDSGVWPNTAMSQVGVLQTGTWSNLIDFGSPNVQPYHDLFLQLFRLCALIHINFSAAEQILIFIPSAILSFVAPFILIRKLTSSNRGGVAGALIYGFSCCMVSYEQTEFWLPLAFAILPICIYFFVELLAVKSWKFAALFLLFTNLIISLDVRVSFIEIIILLIFTSVNFSKSIFSKKLVVQLSIITLLGIITNLYWIIVVSTSSSGAISRTAARDVFGNNFTDFLHSITVTSGIWLSGGNFFTLTTIPMQLWALPLLAIFAVYFENDCTTDSVWRIKLFGLVLLFLGIMESKQNNPPISNFFLFFREYVPGFSIFRTGYFFNFLSITGYSVLVGFLFSKSRFSSYKSFNFITQKFFVGLMALIVSVNLVPMVTGSIGGLFSSQAAPRGLKEIDKLIDGNSFYRTLWIPSTSNWSSYSLNHPRVEFSTVLDRASSKLPTNLISPGLNRLTNSLRFSTLINNFEIKYLVVQSNSHSQNINYAYFGYTRSEILSILNSEKWVKKIGEFGNYVVYENLLFSGSTSVQTKNISPHSMNFLNSSTLMINLDKNILRHDQIYVGVAYSPHWNVEIFSHGADGSVCNASAALTDNCKKTSNQFLLSKYRKNIRLSETSLGTLQINFDDKLRTLIDRSTQNKLSLLLVFGNYASEKLLLRIDIVFYFLLIALLASAHIRNRNKKNNEIQL